MYQIITIGREYGSGGRIVGQKLAQQLNIPFYDREIITMTARQSGFTEEVVAQAEQQRTNSLLYGLYMSTQNLPVNDQVYIAQTGIIRDIAAQGPCVIVGRCADYVLRENPDCLRVFIHAAISDRVRRVSEEYGVQDKNMETLVRREDKKRAGYYSHFTQRKWGSAENYHLSIDSGVGLGLVVQLIAQLATGGNPS